MSKARTKSPRNKSAKPQPVQYMAPRGGLRIGNTTYRTGQPLPPKIAERVLDLGSAQSYSMQPSTDIAPNFGQTVLPHIRTFRGVASTAAHTYRNPDAAIQDSRENALRMRRDCFLMECIEARQRAVALLNWHIEPENPKSQDQRELATAVTSIIKKTPRFTEMRRNLLEAVWYGRYGVQVAYGPLYANGQRRWGVKKSLPINGDKLAFRYDDWSEDFLDKSHSTDHYEDELGILVTGNFKAGDIIRGNRTLESTDWGLAYFLNESERKNVIIHKHMIEDAAFEDYLSAGSIHGVGVRSRIYYTWLQMQETLAMMMEYLQRTGQGLWIYYYPFGNDEARQDVANAAFNERDGNILLIPRMSADASMDAFGVERIDPSPAGLESFKAIAHEFFGRRIKRYILGQTLMSEAEATGLGSGLSDLQYVSFMEIVRYDATNLEETLTTQLIRQIQLLNFPQSYKYDLYFKLDTESPETEKKLNAYRQLYEMGAEIKVSDLFDAIGASMPTEQDKIVANPMIKQQERLWRQSIMQDQMQQAGMPGQGPDDGGPGAIQGGPGAGPQGPGGEDLSDLFGPLANGMPGAGGPGQPQQFKKDGKPLNYRREDAAQGMMNQGNDNHEEATATAPAATNPASGAATGAGAELTAPKPSPEPKAQQPKQQQQPKPELPADINTAYDLDYPNDLLTDEELDELAKDSNWESNEAQGQSQTESNNEPESEQQAEQQPEAEAQNQEAQTQPQQPQQPEEIPTPEQHNESASKAVSSVPVGPRNIITALRQSPQFKSKGAYSTHDFAPEQVTGVHSELSKAVGTEYNGGRVVDLSRAWGQGAIGYSTPAGALVLVPPKAEGQKWQIHYTAVTGVVRRGGLDGSGNDTSGKKPGFLDRAADKVIGVADKLIGVDRSLAKDKQRAAGANPRAAQSNRDAEIKRGLAGLEQQARGQEPSQQQIQQPPQQQIPVGTLLPNPGAGVPLPDTSAAANDPLNDSRLDTFQPPIDPKPLREKADQLQAKRNTLLDEWESKVDTLTPKENAQYRSKLAAINSQYNAADKDAGKAESAYNKHLEQRNKLPVSQPADSQPTTNTATATAAPSATAKNFSDKLDSSNIRDRMLGIQSQLDQGIAGEASAEPDQQPQPKPVPLSKQDREQTLTSGMLPDGRNLHELTRSEFSQLGLPILKHKNYVVDALQRGIELPEAVLSEYHEIASRQDRAKQRDVASTESRLATALRAKLGPGTGAKGKGGAITQDEQAALIAAGLTKEQIAEMPVVEAKALALTRKSEFLQRQIENEKAKAAAIEQRQQLQKDENQKKLVEDRTATYDNMKPEAQQLYEAAFGHPSLTKSEKFEANGIASTNENLNLITKAIADGDITNAKDLDQVLKTAGKKIGTFKGQMNAVDQGKAIQQAISERFNQVNRQSPKQIISQAAKDNSVDESTLNSAIDEVLGDSQNDFKELESEKLYARKKIGEGIASLNRKDDQGIDYTKMKDFDLFMKNALGMDSEGRIDPSRAELPRLSAAVANMGGTDYSQNAIEILKSEASDAPQRHNEETIKQALALIKHYKQSSQARGDAAEDDGTHAFWDDSEASSEPGNNEEDPLAGVPFAKEIDSRLTYQQVIDGINSRDDLTRSQKSAMRILYQRANYPETFLM